MQASRSGRTTLKSPSYSFWRWLSAIALLLTIAACGGGGTAPPEPAAPVAATIASLSPAGVAAGSAAFTLTVNGSGFVAGSVVSLNSTALTTTFVSAAQLTASVPAAAVASAGDFSATVRNPSGVASNAASFTITAMPAAPSITAISPATATAGSAAFTLTVNGSAFSAASIVKLGGVALSTSFVSVTQLTAVVPGSAVASAASLAVQVANSSASVSNDFNLVVSAPSAPGIGPQGGTVNGAYGAQVIVPAGALASNIDIGIARDSTNAPDFPPSEIGAAGAAFEITPHGTAFALPVTVRIPFDAAQVPADATPKLFKAEAGGTFAEIATTVDGGMLVAQVTDLSWFVPGYDSTRPRIVYALSSGSGVSSYRINAATGALSAATSTAPTGQSPISVLAHPSGRFVYVTNGGSTNANGVAPNSISVYRLDAVSGAISGPTSTVIASSAPAGQQTPAGLAIVHPSGRFVYVVNFGPFGGNTDVSVFRVDGTTGALSGPTSSADSDGAPPTAIAIDPSGRFAYVTYVFGLRTPVGNAYFDQVKVYSIDANTGLLTGPTASASAAGTPWSIAVEPTGRFAYVASKDRNSNRVHVYTIDAATGALTQRSSSPVSNQPASIAIDPLGRFVYVGLQESFGDNVESYRINPSFGALNNPVGFGLVANGGGVSPIAVVAEPRGEFIYAMHTGNTSSELAAFKVNPGTGALTSVGAVSGVMSMGGLGAGTPFSFAATGTSPIWVDECTFDCSVGSVVGGSGGGGGGAGGDTTAPSITITGPTSAPTYAGSSASLTTLAGTASDAVGVTQVTWSNSLGGSGSATGTTHWSVASIALQSGVNGITVTAHDAAGNIKTDSVLVSFNAGAGVGGTQFLNVTRGSWGGHIVSTPAGIDYGDATNLFSAGFASATVVKLCATPPSTPLQAYDITWTGACSGTASCTNVLMDRDRECRLELTPRP